MASAVGLTVLCLAIRPPVKSDTLIFPAAFGVSTILLFWVSAALHRAVQAVRWERQPEFRKQLRTALITGVLFVGVQGYGLACLISGGQPNEAQLGARPFLFVFAFLHCLHVTVALLFLSFIVVRGFAGRYDHEYYWGPFITGWFWHFLGIVWLVLLGVLGISL